MERYGRPVNGTWSISQIHNTRDLEQKVSKQARRYLICFHLTNAVPTRQQ